MAPDWPPVAAALLSAAERTGAVLVTMGKPPRSQGEALGDLAAAMGRPAVPVSGIPRWTLTALGAVVPVLRELADVRHQFDAPFVTGASATTATFGLEPTPWAEVVAATAGAARVAA